MDSAGHAAASDKRDRQTLEDLAQAPVEGDPRRDAECLLHRCVVADEVALARRIPVDDAGTPGCRLSDTPDELRQRDRLLPGDVDEARTIQRQSRLEPRAPRRGHGWG